MQQESQDDLELIGLAYSDMKDEVLCFARSPFSATDFFAGCRMGTVYHISLKNDLSHRKTLLCTVDEQVTNIRTTKDAFYFSSCIYVYKKPYSNDKAQIYRPDPSLDLYMDMDYVRDFTLVPHLNVVVVGIDDAYGKILIYDEASGSMLYCHNLGESKMTLSAYSTGIHLLVGVAKYIHLFSFGDENKSLRPLHSITVDESITKIKTLCVTNPDTPYVEEALIGQSNGSIALVRIAQENIVILTTINMFSTSVDSISIVETEKGFYIASASRDGQIKVHRHNQRTSMVMCVEDKLPGIVSALGWARFGNRLIYLVANDKNASSVKTRTEVSSVGPF